MNNSKKKVLMFCTSFFGYEKRIANALAEEGYEVDLYDERPNSSFIGKACVRYNVKFYKSVIRKYIRQIIAERKNSRYDYVLVVKGEAITTEAVAMLRQAYPEAKFVLYMWDSVANAPQCEKRVKLYDKAMTFDPSDAEKLGIEFLPIPYDKNAAGFETKSEYKYDIAFIGTAHSVRPRIVKQVEKWCRDNNRSMYAYFYSPHILVYMYNKLTNPDYRWISLKDIHFESMSSDVLYDIYSNSKCVMDIEHPKQHGATTRPVEMLPMKKKVITTNAFVKEFPFYDKNNFLIIDRKAPVIDSAFLDSEYKPVDSRIIESYSPEEFVRTLLKE